MNFKLPAVLSSVMKCHAVLVHPPQNVSHPVVQRLHAVPAPRRLSGQRSDQPSRHRSACVHVTLVLPTSGSKASHRTLVQHIVVLVLSYSSLFISYGAYFIN